MTRKHLLVVFALIAITELGVLGCSKKDPVSSNTIPNAPILQTPINGAINVNSEYSPTRPILSWYVSNGATSYTLQVSIDSLFSNFIYNKSDLTSNSQTVGGLADSTVYYWRVNAKNNYGTSGWSSRWSFTTGGCVEWVTIPAGNFKMGSLPTDPYAQTNEQPQHTIYLDAYQISKYEVTNSQYADFINNGGYTNSIYWTSEGWTWLTTNNIIEPYYWSSGEFNSGLYFPKYPVVGISWYEADAYCRWLGVKLPSEAQWEKAARGIDARYWPWGNTWDPAKCNCSVNALPDTFTYSSPIGFFITGTSPFGCYDMAGNVLEWVNDWYQSDYYSISPTINPTGPITGTTRIARGGGYIYPDYYYCRTALRYVEAPTNRGNLYGFRPAK